MNRLVIFAGYDKYNIMHDYVVYYIKELKKIADIIYVSDCDMSDIELEKIKDCCIHIINGRHKGYDFGSYKRGYLYAYRKDILKDYDNIIFCNDSVYGPFNDLNKIVNDMEKRCLDAWSMFYCFADGINHYHLHSYFLHIKKDIFLSKGFFDFIDSIYIEKNKEDYIAKYEEGITNYCMKNNYKIGGYLDSSLNMQAKNLNLPFYEPILVIKNNYPFLKRSLFYEYERFNFTVIDLIHIFNFIKDRYNIKFVIDNVYKVVDKEGIENKKRELTNNTKIKPLMTLFSLFKIINFSLLSVEYNEKYIIIYIFGIKFTIKRHKSHE